MQHPLTHLLIRFATLSLLVTPYVTLSHHTLFNTATGNSSHGQSAHPLTPS